MAEFLKHFRVRHTLETLLWETGVVMENEKVVLEDKVKVNANN